MKKVIALMGLPQSGKSTAGKLLSKFTGWRMGTCSTVIYNILAKLDNLPPGDWHEVTAPEDKDRVRQRLIALGNAMGEEVPFVFPVALFNRGCRIVDGIRRRSEFEATEKFCEEHNLDLWKIWIERPDRPPLTDNNELNCNDADEIIRAESVEELEHHIRDLVLTMRANHV